MIRVDSALPSPRIVNGILQWYEGDEFEAGFKLELKDSDGEEITLTETDTVTVIVKNDRLEEIKTFEFSGIEDNSINIVFDSEVTALFKAGTYFYDIRLGGTYNTTVVKNNVMNVE
ncbi:MAG: hypothetical protein LUE88_01420 [Clostridiales bacterium]|nr:hypothetical protein [Clostridiales bacterium]